MGFPDGSGCKKSACKAETWVGKIPWRKAWQPTPVFLPGESPRTGGPGGLQSRGSQSIRHDWVTKRSTALRWGSHCVSLTQATVAGPVLSAGGGVRGTQPAWKQQTWLIQNRQQEADCPAAWHSRWRHLQDCTLERPLGGIGTAWPEGLAGFT